MGVKHIHADLIKAWADGVEIQVYVSYDAGWKTVTTTPVWSCYSKYRIKPTPPQEPDYAQIAKDAWHSSALGVLRQGLAPVMWKETANAVIAAYQQYQEDMKVYQNGTA